MQTNDQSKDRPSAKTEKVDVATTAEETATAQSGGKDPDTLPDGSGTDRKDGGSEQGQEDGGKSFDAG